MAYTLSNKCAKNLSKRTVLLQLIIKNVVTCVFGTQCIALETNGPRYKVLLQHVRDAGSLLRYFYVLAVRQIVVVRCWCWQGPVHRKLSAALRRNNATAVARQPVTVPRRASKCSFIDQPFSALTTASRRSDAKLPAQACPMLVSLYDRQEVSRKPLSNSTAVLYVTL